MITNKDIKRFKSKYVTDLVTGCHEWISSKTPQGYGSFWFNKTTIRAHRFSYIIKNGQIPENMFICHRCDNPSCVRPEHLFLGTATDNMKDMVNKNRGKTTFVYGNLPTRINAKLSLKDYNTIKEDYLLNKCSQYKLARKYNINQSNISRIVRSITGKSFNEQLEDKK